jgi:curved DNA-binding protein CbpA
MNPYRELGVHPTASIDEIEARYRLLMREHHPDFHQDEGAEAIAEAERRTRNLNFAMDRIRQDRETEGATPAWTWDEPYEDDGPNPSDPAGRRKGPWAGDNPFWRPPDERSTRVNNDTRARDWEGNAIPTDRPVPCPFCRKPFDRLAEYEQHLRDVHRFRDAPADDGRPRRLDGFFRAIGVLRFIPAWLVLLVAIAFWVMLGFLWFVGIFVFLALVLWTQTSKRFRNR